MQEDKYRLERWIVVMLLSLFALPFVGTAEEFYAQKGQKTAPVQQHAQKRTTVHRATPPALPEDSMQNAIDLDE